MASCAYASPGMFSSLTPVILSSSMSPNPPITVSPSRPAGNNQVYQGRPTSPCGMYEQSVTAFLNSSTESLPPGGSSAPPSLQATPLALTPQKPLYARGPGQTLLSPFSVPPTTGFSASPQMMVSNQSPMIYTSTASPIYTNGTPNSSMNVSRDFVTMNVSTPDFSGFQQAPPPTPSSEHARYLARNQVWPESPFFLSTPFNSPSGSLLCSFPSQHMVQLTPDQFYLNVPSWGSPNSPQYQSPGVEMMTAGPPPGRPEGYTEGSTETCNYRMNYYQQPVKTRPRNFDWNSNSGQSEGYAPTLGNVPQLKQSSEQGMRMDGARVRLTNREPSRTEMNSLLKKVEGDKWKTAFIGLVDLSPWELKQLMMDRGGSKYIQDAIGKDGTEWGMLFDVVMGSAEELSKDIYANYVIQKVALLGTLEQKMQLSAFVVEHLHDLSYHRHSCRVVQAVITGGNDAIQADVLMAIELSEDVLKFTGDQNRNHIIQVAIRDTKSKGKIQFIIDAIVRHHDTVPELACHPFGCRVIQQIVEMCPQRQKQAVIDILIRNLKPLVMDQYGNYVIQRVLDFGSVADKKRICAGLKPNLFQYCQHKHASPVVEKCLEIAPQEDRNALIAEIMDPKPFGNERGKRRMSGGLEYLLKDQFANYVIQKILDLSEDEPELRVDILRKMKPVVANLQKFNYGKHILAKLQKYFEHKLLSEDGNETGIAE